MLCVIRASDYTPKDPVEQQSRTWYNARRRVDGGLRADDQVLLLFSGSGVLKCWRPVARSTVSRERCAENLGLRFPRALLGGGQAAGSTGCWTRRTDTGSTLWT